MLTVVSVLVFEFYSTAYV